MKLLIRQAQVGNEQRSVARSGRGATIVIGTLRSAHRPTSLAAYRSFSSVP